MRQRNGLAMVLLVAVLASACEGVATGPIGIGSSPRATPTETPLALTWGLDDTPPSPDWVRPGRLTPYQDPVYGTEMRRLTDADGTRFDRNTYSRRQAENADGSLVFSYHGSAAYRVHDRRSGEVINDLDIHPDAEPQWHPVDPWTIRFLAGPTARDGDLLYREVDVRTGQQRVIADLSARLTAVFPAAHHLSGRAEGSPSVDGDRSAWMVFDRDGRRLGVVSHELSTDRILGVLTSFDGGVGPADWVSMSPTGSHVVVGHHERTVVYDADLTNRRILFEGGEHSDLALGADGNDVYVYIDFTAGPNGGWLMVVDLDSLDRRRLFDLYADANTSIHVSGKGHDRPGWVVVSTYNCKVVAAWSCDKVMAVELSSGRVLNLAHTYNCGDSYWTEPHAVVNRAFTRVYVNSDAGSCGIDAEVYELTLPEFE